MAGSNASGKEWYLFNFFAATPSSSGLSFNADGSLKMQGLGGINAQIATAADLGSGNFVGTAFGGGGYFEATLAFDNTLVNTANGWPSFWGMAIQHLAQQSAQHWSGQAAGYNHFIEADILEYDINGTVPQYGAGLHDWYGIASPQFTDLASAGTRPGISGIDWKSYHKVGMLWIPATSTTSGSVTFYLDDIQQGSPITWAQFTGQTPPPTSQPWAFGIFDQQHIPLILGSGLNQPLTVQSVRVWQASAAGNLVN